MYAIKIGNNLLTEKLCSSGGTSKRKSGFLFSSIIESIKEASTLQRLERLRFLEFSAVLVKACEKADT